MVTPPLAAIDGSTFKLKTATTNSSTRSRCPRTRFRCGWVSAVFASTVNVLLSENSPRKPAASGGKNRFLASLGMTTHDCAASVSSRDRHHAALGLRFCKTRRNLLEHRQVLINVGIHVLHRNRPLLVPPVGLRQHAAVHHGEPVVPPQIDVDF